MYSRGKELKWRQVRDVQALGTMGLTGGARNALNPRLLSLMTAFAVQMPSDASLRAICTPVLLHHAASLGPAIARAPAPSRATGAGHSLLAARARLHTLAVLTTFGMDAPSTPARNAPARLRCLAASLPSRVKAGYCMRAAMTADRVGALLELYAHVLSALPATPARFHYLFNPRDLSRVLEGLLLSTAPRCAAPAAILRLWRNECLRVFHDRLISDEDKQARPALPDPQRQAGSACRTRVLDCALCQRHATERPRRQARASSALAAPARCSIIVSQAPPHRWHKVSGTRCSMPACSKHLLLPPQAVSTARQQTMDYHTVAWMRSSLRHAVSLCRWSRGRSGCCSRRTSAAPWQSRLCRTPCCLARSPAPRRAPGLALPACQTVRTGAQLLIRHPHPALSACQTVCIGCTAAQSASTCGDRREPERTPSASTQT